MVSKKPTIKRVPKGGAIQFHILLRMAYKNLFFNKLRTTLTILGVIIGIGSIVFLFSFGFGIQNLVTKQVVGSSSVQTVDVTSPRSKILKLNKDVISQINGMSGVTQIGKSYSTAGKFKNGSSQTETVVFGADSNFIDLSSLKFANGKVFDTVATDKVIINKSLANASGMGDSANAINRTISVSFEATDSRGAKKTIAKDFTITGVFESESRAELFIPLSNFEQIGGVNATQLKVVVKKQEQVTTVRNAIESLGFVTSSPLDTLQQIDQVFSLLRYVFIGFGGIGIVIAILGMFNTLTITLIERTREIALMISLGARKQDVRRLFTAEALMLSFLGGMFGIFGAVILGIIGNFALNSYARHNGVRDTVSAFSFSFPLVAITLMLSTMIGFIVVFFPARRAAMIDPMDALHND